MLGSWERPGSICHTFYPHKAYILEKMHHIYDREINAVIADDTYEWKGKCVL